MGNFIKTGMNVLLKPFGFILQEREREWEREAYARLYESRIQYASKPAAYPAEGIVFSRDRALQLHALLSSYLEKVASPVPLHILYHPSTSSHQRAYDELIKIFPDKFSFVKQSSDASFRNDLIKMLDSIQAPKTFFLVDDIVFIENLDMRDFTKFDTDKIVPSLRMGLNLKRCYPLRKDQPLPGMTNDVSKDEDKIYWRWNEGMYDWCYPLSVDGHLFSTQEIGAMTTLISFSAPNTYEDQLQKFRRFFLLRKGAGYKKSKIVNIPCNKVQRENKNISGNTHPDFLLAQWIKGYQMDYQRLYGFPNVSAHQEIPFEFIKR